MILKATSGNKISVGYIIIIIINKIFFFSTFFSSWQA